MALTSGASLAVLPVVVLVGWLYTRGTMIMWRRAGIDRGVSRAQVFAFLTGLLTILAAVLSPLDTLAHTVFAGHMAQHMLLMLVAAPLLAYGAPGLPLMWALPSGPRRRSTRWWAASTTRRTIAMLMHPVSVLMMFAVVLWAWHLPALYQLALVSPLVHTLEHWTLLLASYLFWAALLQPLGRRRLTGGGAILYLFIASLQVTVLGALISLAPRPLYPMYEVGAGLFGMSATEDQRLAALVMRTPMALVFVAVLAVLFLSWLRALDKRASGERS